MIIMPGSYSRVDFSNNTKLDEETLDKLKRAMELVSIAKKGVTIERGPLTLVEKSQMSDTTKMVEKIVIDFYKGRDNEKNRKKLDNAIVALKTSIENILTGGEV